MTNDASALNSNAGTARLWIVIPVTMLSFFYLLILEYSLPLYFSALRDAALAQGESYPAGLYSTLWKYTISAWIIGPFLAGLLSRRYGERRVWCVSQLSMALIPLALVFYPEPNMVKIIALFYGFMGALMWISGFSMVQMVRPERKGLSNGLMMAAVGAGAVLGPICARAMIYWQGELNIFFQQNDWSGFAQVLFSFTPTTMVPRVADFLPIFWLLVVVKLLCGLMVGLWSQRPGRFGHEDGEQPDWSRTIRDLKRLASEPRFWALVLTLCVLGAPIFQASNQFLPYRAEDLGLKNGASDNGWVWLHLLRTFMWIPGGLAVALVAGRRAPGIVGVAMLGCFAMAALGIAFSSVPWALFTCVAAFAFVRQFMRWSHAGYISEHLPADLRATAMGCAIACVGMAATTFAWSADYLFSPDLPDFDSSQPFFFAALLGLIGCLGLFIFDWFCPIRQPLGETTTIVEAPSAFEEEGDKT